MELDAAFFPPHREIGMAYIQLRRYDKAIEHLRKALALQPRDTFALGQLGLAWGLSGKHQKATETLAELRRRSRRKYVSPDDLALVCVGVGNLTQALSYLEAAYEDRAHWLNFAKVDALLDPVRSMARFRHLLGRMGLP